MSDTIYFLLDGHGRAVKIGFSSQPEKRISALSRGDRASLTCLGFVAGTRAHERKLHDLLKTHRLGGEWFEANEEVLRTIADVTTQGVSFLGLSKQSIRPLDPVMQRACDLAQVVVKHSAAFSPGPIMERLAFLEKQYGFPPSVLWKMQYGQAADLSTSKYFDLLNAAETFLADAEANISRELQGLRALIASHKEATTRVSKTERELAELEAEAAALRHKSGKSNDL